MEGPLDVVIIMSRCTQNKESFGIRLEKQQQGEWQADWAFAVQTGTAQREGYDHNKINGTFTIAHNYPGCPSCKAIGFKQCHCQKISCWDTQSMETTCPWCDQEVHLSNQPITQLQAGDDL